MIISPIHLVLNDIRKHYTGKKVSLCDIRIIENEYKVCSILNTRRENCAYLRITSYGLKEIVFEDVCVNFENIPPSLLDMHEFIFTMNKALYEIAYGVDLVDDSRPLLKKYIKPSFDLKSIEDEFAKLQEKCKALENQLKNDGITQLSVFDLDIK